MQKASMDMKYKLGVLGKGISYSLSPEIHNFFSKQSNIDIEYKIYDIHFIDIVDTSTLSLEISNYKFKF